MSIHEDDDLPIWLDLIEIGCSDPRKPLSVTLINAVDGKTCFSETISNWKNLQPMDVVGGAVQPLNAVTTDVFTEIPFRVASRSGMSYVDLRLLTAKGTLPESTKRPLNSATAAIIFAVVAIFTLAFIFGYFYQYRVQILTRLGIRKDTPADPASFDKQPSINKLPKANPENKV